VRCCEKGDDGLKIEGGSNSKTVQVRIAFEMALSIVTRAFCNGRRCYDSKPEEDEVTGHEGVEGLGISTSVAKGGQYGR